MYANNKIIRVAAGAMLISSVAVLATACPSMAQRVNKNALEKTKFYESPREIQIIDDRPVVRDFREAPQDAGSIELPPGPQGSGGGSGGSGAGALGGGPGSSIPAGGMPIGGPNQGFRTPSGGSLPLPKSGFGRETNIPARGMAPRNALPNGSTNNQLMGKMLNQGTGHGVGGGAPRGMSQPTGRSNGNYSGPPVAASYGGYGQGSGSNSGSASRTESNVRGFLLNKHN
jgi:hypothetical protein